MTQTKTRLVEPIMFADTAMGILPRLLRAWRLIATISTYRKTDRKLKLRAALLQYVYDVVDEHYDFNRPVPPDTSVGEHTHVLFAEREIALLEELAVRMVRAVENPALEPTQAAYRRAFVYSAVTACQLMRPPTTSVQLFAPRAQSTHAAIEA